MTSEFKYRAFLSYSHQDRKIAKRLHHELERFRVPKHLFGSETSDRPGNLRPIFRDRDELSSGAALHQVIEDALQDSESLIVVCSPAAVASKWVNDEIENFQRLGKGNRIFGFIISGTPFSGDEQECFPEALRNPVGINGQPVAEPDEPIAADASHGKSEWRHAKMMLIAGLLDVGLDRLLQRDHQRRSRNMIAIATSSLAITLIMAGLAVYAYLSQAEAQRRQADADNLVTFLLEDLREELFSIGRIELYNDVSSKAMEYFKSLENEDARDEVLAQRAEALRQIGNAMIERADLQSAMKSFYEALTISQRLVEKHPERPDWNLALAESHFFVGEVYWQRGDLDAASEQFQSQLTIVDSLANAQPDNTERLLNSGYAWTNYGRILELSGRYDETLVAYQTVMEVFQRLMELEPQSSDSLLEVGFAHNNLGKLKTSKGLLEEAEAHFRADLDLKLQVSKTAPENNMWQGYVASSHLWLGKLLQSRGDLTDARQQHEAALKILNLQLLHEPGAANLRRQKAAAHTVLAANCRMSGDFACASENVTIALIDMDILTSASPENVRWLHYQSLSKLEFSWQAQLRGDHATALESARSSEQIINQVISQTPTDLEVRVSQILILLTLGDFAQQSAQLETAQSHWNSALKILNQHFPVSVDPKVLELQSRLLTRTNQLADAQKIKSVLAEMDYLSPYPWP